MREWIYRFELTPAGVAGDRVAPQRCPIVRWSKGSVSRFRDARGTGFLHFKSGQVRSYLNDLICPVGFTDHE